MDSNYLMFPAVNSRLTLDVMGWVRGVAKVL